MIKDNTYAGHILRIALGITILILLLPDLAGAASSGNRIWSEGMDKTYTWDSSSFAGFYYNLNDNLGTEELTINDIQRNIGRGKIYYTTSPIEVSFGYSGFGKYQVIGFMADKYFAGYTTNSIISNNKVKSTLESMQLHKVLLDDEEKRVVSEGGTLTLKEGYVLKIKEMDIGAGPGQVWVVLLKDGVEVDNGAVSGGNTYIYSTRVGKSPDMPIIAVHFDTVFRGREVNAAFVRGVFQISESFTSLKAGDRYGEMEISSVYSGGIQMVNSNSVYLSPGSTIDLLGDLKIVVADSDVLRFALSVEKVGTFEARGTIYPATDEWTPMNFGLNLGGSNVGFYYDMDKDIGKEDLKIESLSGTSIPKNGLRYSTSPEEISFDYSGFGKYKVIGFMADKYFAGYTKNSIISHNQEMNLLSRMQLHKVLLDDENKYTVAEGGTLTLKDGYVLKMKEIDTGAGTGQILIALLKDGKEIDTDVVSGSDTYIYSTKVGNVSDLPIIAVHFDAVFRGREMNAVFTKGIFQLSESFTTAKSGDRYGEMEIDTINPGGIEMRNWHSIGLSSGETVDLMGDIKFKVADSSTLRFYPFVMVTPEMVAYQLSVDAPAKANAGDAITIKTTSGSKAIEGVSITLGSDIGQTDKDGILNYTLRKTMKGTYYINATKLGYQKASKAIVIQEYFENRLIIDTPAKANQFETMTIRVINKGMPVSGAVVSYDNAIIGQTDSSGTLNYTLQDSGTHTIYATKSGYIAAAKDIDVAVPFAEFKALDINPPDIVFTGEKAVIRSNVTNIGTKADTLPVALIINNTEMDSKPVTLAPSEVEEVTFEEEITLPAGNYTVEVLGQKKEIEVKESQTSIFLIIGAIIGIGAIIIYLLTSKGLSLSMKKLPVKGEEKKA